MRSEQAASGLARLKIKEAVAHAGWVLIRSSQWSCGPPQKKGPKINLSTRCYYNSLWVMLLYVQNLQQTHALLDIRRGKSAYISYSGSDLQSCPPPPPPFFPPSIRVYYLATCSYRQLSVGPVTASTFSSGTSVSVRPGPAQHLQSLLASMPMTIGTRKGAPGVRTVRPRSLSAPGPGRGRRA